MKYALLIYDNPAERPADEVAAERLNAQYAALTQTIIDAGEMVGGERLARADVATSVRIRAGQVSVTDGPFAETKEHLGGFYLIDVPDLDRALAVAAEIPAAKTGVIEIRPVVPYSG